MTIKSNRNTILIIALLIIAIAIITKISPAEKTLGDLVKTIYIHAALIWASIIMFSAAGLLGLGFCFSGKDSLYQWSSATEYIAISIWSINFLFSLVLMSLIWGGIAWNEPRTLMSLTILIFSIVLIFARLITASAKVKGFYNFLMSVILWFELVRTNVVIHPAGAISASTSTAIKIYTIIISLLVFMVTILLAAFVRNKLVPVKIKTE